MFQKDEFPPINMFIEQFIGAEVEIFTGVMQKTETNDAEGNQIIEELPLAIRGFVLGCDEDWIFLGETPDFITKCVGKGPGIIIERVKEGSELDDILENFPTEGNGN